MKTVCFPTYRGWILAFQAFGDNIIQGLLNQPLDYFIGKYL